MTILDQILKDTRKEVEAARAARPLEELKRMVADAPAPLGFGEALKGKFRLIAEIKERSPSMGPMRAENVAEAADAYEESDAVAAISVLTNQTHFGMDIARLGALRKRSKKPLLRKDFLFEEYQIWEARAYGADAVLLMANVLDDESMRRLYALAEELGMDALFEVHTSEELARLPENARIIGVNSRKFRTTTGFVRPGESAQKDFSVNLDVFELAKEIPAGRLRVAESGLSPEHLPSVVEEFDAALVGTSLLRAPHGLREELARFERMLPS